MPDASREPSSAASAHHDPGTRWAAPVGASWKHRAFLFIIRWLGRWPAYAVAWLTSFWYCLSPTVRRRSRPYLDRRFPERVGALQRFFDAFHLARNFAEALIDQAAGSFHGPTELRAACADAGRIQELIDEGRGLVVVNAHVGSWQAAMPVLDVFDTPVSVVMIAPGRDDPRTLGKDLPFTVIDPRRGMPAVVEMVQALGRREIVGLMGDRIFGDESNAVETEFLGDRILVPFAPYRLASATGAPVAVLMCPKTGWSSFEIRLARVIRPPSGLGRDPAAYEPWAREFALALEEFVEEHPFQFYNFFDLWEEARRLRPPRDGEP